MESSGIEWNQMELNQMESNGIERNQKRVCQKNSLRPVKSKIEIYNLVRATRLYDAGETSLNVKFLRRSALNSSGCV